MFVINKSVYAIRSILIYRLTMLRSYKKRMKILKTFNSFQYFVRFYERLFPLSDMMCHRLEL